MRATTLLSAVFLSQYATLISARPGGMPYWVTDGLPVCANAPSIVAGTVQQLKATGIASTDMNARSYIPKSSSDQTLESDDSSLPDLLIPRRGTETIRWCTRGTRTFILITLVHSIPGNSVRRLLDEAYSNVQNTITQNHDGVISGGLFRYLGENGITFRANDANGHHLTYGVLGAALQAIHDFMSNSEYYFGAATFTISDGENQVGTGVIG